MERWKLTVVLGTPLYGQKMKSPGVPDEITIVRAGIFDDEVLNHHKPEAELYTSRRVSWVRPVEGAGQVTEMMPLS